MAQGQIIVRRKKPTETRIQNRIIWDENVSPMARFSLIAMLSMREGWDYSVRGMAAMLHISKDTMSKYIRELESAGYLKRTQEQGENGQFCRSVYILTDVPWDFGEEPCPKNYDTDEPCPNFPAPETPAPETPAPEKSPQQIYSNKQQNDNKEHTSLTVSQECVTEIEEALSGVVVHDDNRSAVVEVAAALEKSGYICQCGVLVPARSSEASYRGRINIVATKAGRTIALSLDRKAMREKSIFMLREYPCDCRIILLRNGSAASPPAGIDAVIPLRFTDTKDLFLQFWDAYPRKADKQKALKAWQRLNPDASLCNVIFRALENQKRSVQWTRDEGRFVPYASTWLNGRRWEDELPPAETPQPEPPEDDGRRGRWL